MNFQSRYRRSLTIVLLAAFFISTGSTPARAAGIGGYAGPFQSWATTIETVFAQAVAFVQPHHTVTVDISHATMAKWHATGATASAAAFNSDIAASQPKELAPSPTIVHVDIASNASVPTAPAATSKADHPVSTTSSGAVLGTSTTDGVVMQSQLQAAVEQASNTLRQLIYANAGSVIGQGQYATGGYTNNIALSERIDSLSNVTISNATVHGVSGLTASEIPADIVAANYLPLSGGTVSGNFSILGSTTLSNLALGTNCSTYANGGKLTTDGFGNVLCAADQGGAGSTVGGSDTQIQFNSGGSFAGSANFVFSSSTNQLTVTNASTSNATSTNLFATLGNFTTAVANTFNASIANIVGFTATNATTANATTTNLYVYGTATLARALPISSGGTGISTAPSYGQLLLGNNTSGYAFAATSTLGLPTFADLSADLGNYLPLSSWYATTTNGLAEGSNNLYFTGNRVASVIAGTTTDALAQGTTNKYYSSLLFASDFAGTTTATLKEGVSNLYFTNTRAQNAISVSGTPLTYSGGVLGINQATLSQNGYLSSTDFTTFQNKISSSSLSAAAPLAYNSSTGAFSITQAGTGASGYLSSADWTTFNGKLGSTSLSNGTGIGYNSSTGVISNTGVVSLAATYPLQTSGSTGALTISTAFGTTTANTFSALNTFNGGVTANVLTAGTSASLASTTLTGNTLFTNATTTSFAIANVSSSLLKALSNGAVVAAVAGTDYLTPANVFAYPFPSNATTTQIAFNGGATFAGATTTALAVTGSTTISGQLNAVGGATFGTVTAGAVTGTSFAGAGTGLTGTASGLAIGGNALTATTLQTARNINGISFNGSTDITLTAAAATLTGSTLNSTVTASSLTSVGTLSSLTVATLSGILKATSGVVSAATAGTDYENPLTFNYPLTRSTNAISLAFSTTTQNFFGAYNIFSSLFATNASTTNATTTNLHITSLANGGLAVDANGRVYSAATSTLATISGTLGVAGGGTGATSLTGLLQGNGSSALTAIGGSAGQFPYYNGANTLLATSSLFLATTGNVGIGTTSPQSLLTLAASDPSIWIDRAANTHNGTVDFYTSSTHDWRLGLRGTSDSNFHLYSYGAAADALTVSRSSGGTTLGGALTYGGVTLSNAVTGTGNMVLSGGRHLPAPQ
jgi:hypothetical protein